MSQTFEQWMDEVDQLGIKERFFDSPEVKFLCPGSRARRPSRDKDSIWFLLWREGCPPQMALGEAMIEQDWG